MKRLAAALSALLLILALTPTVFADDLSAEISDSLSKLDTSSAGDALDSLGIDPAEPESVQNLSPKGILSFVSNAVGSALKSPLRLIMGVLAISAVASVCQSLSTRAGLHSELFSIIAFLYVASTAARVFSDCAAAIRSCDSFMLGYIPLLGGLAAASGNLSAAVSYNAILMYFCEGAALVATYFLRPVLCCLLVLSAVRSLEPNSSGFGTALKNAVTTVIGFLMTLFLGIIGLESAFGRATEGLLIKTGKYAVSSFVPIIGYSLSESYKAVSVSINALRTAVGTLGIVIIFVFMLAPIVSVLVYKTLLSVCGFACRLMGSEPIASLMYSLSEVFSFLSTVLIFFMLMLLVATGMMILLGGTLIL